MIKEDYYIIKYKYEMGVYSLKEMCNFVELNWITEDNFHSITSYNYKAIKEKAD